ncbi:MAG: hypothetical protein ACRECH_06950 [Nitrososphaerales archaeon]
MRPTFSANISEEESKYGLHYFDKTPAGAEGESEDESTDDEYDEKSCPAGCCDGDCECDDCSRCSDLDLKDDDVYEVSPAAA